MRPSSSGTGASSIEANAGWNAVLPESRRSTNRRPDAASYPIRVADSSSPSTLSPTASASPGAITASMRTTSPVTGSVSEPEAIGRAASVKARSACSSWANSGTTACASRGPSGVDTSSTSRGSAIALRHVEVGMSFA